MIDAERVFDRADIESGARHERDPVAHRDPKVRPASAEEPGDCSFSFSDRSDLSLAQFMLLQAWVTNAPEGSLICVAYSYRTSLRFTLTGRPEDDVLMSVAEHRTWAALASPDEL